MTREYVTIGDQRFLAKALVLHRSLLRHGGAFRLTLFCDEASRDIVERLELPQLRTVTIAELEAADPEFAAVRPTRTLGEYMWTAKAAALRQVLAELPESATVSFLDADQMFFADPETLFEEMGDASVMITPHRFAREHAAAAVSGIYNSGFVTFRNDERGRATLEWWRERCIEWCYHRDEPDRAGDQKYLDRWPEDRDGVHVLSNVGAGLAPWNLSRYTLRQGPEGLMVEDTPLVFFHYHRVELRSSGPHQSRPAGYHVPRRVRRLVYRPYLEEIDAVLADVRAVAPGFDAGLEERPSLRERIAKRIDEARLMLLAHAGPLRRLPPAPDAG